MDRVTWPKYQYVMGAMASCRLALAHYYIQSRARKGHIDAVQLLWRADGLEQTQVMPKQDLCHGVVRRALGDLYQGQSAIGSRE